MTDVRITKVEGLAALDQALGELPKSVARNTLERTLRKGAEPLHRIWQGLAPRLTGELVASIVVGKKLTRRQARMVRRNGGKWFGEIYVGTSDPAGMMTEFGNIHQAAEPSGRPAWEETQDLTLQIISEDLGDEIEKSRVRLARRAARLAAKV